MCSIYLIQTKLIKCTLIISRIMHDVKLIKQHAQQYHKTHNNTDINVEIQYCLRAVRGNTTGTKITK